MLVSHFGSEEMSFKTTTAPDSVAGPEHGSDGGVHGQFAVFWVAQFELTMVDGMAGGKSFVDELLQRPGQHIGALADHRGSLGAAEQLSVGIEGSDFAVFVECDDGSAEAVAQDSNEIQAIALALEFCSWNFYRHKVQQAVYPFTDRLPNWQLGCHIIAEISAPCQCVRTAERPFEMGKYACH
jgi:hypothetical protein